MEDKNNVIDAAVKAITVWLGALLGQITLNRVVLLSTLIYTWLQVYFLWKNKGRKHEYGPD